MGGPFPLTAIYRHQYELDAAKEVLIERDDERPRLESPVGGETYLRLLEVDLSDPEDILRFANQHGRLGVYEPTEDWRAVEMPLRNAGTPELWEELEPKLSTARLRVGQIHLEEDQRWLEQQEPSLQRAYAKSHPNQTAEDLAWAIDPSYESIEEFRAGATAIRLAVGYWRLLRGDFSYEDVAASTDVDPRLVAIEAADYLNSFFDWGLEPFHPGISVSWDGAADADTFRRAPQIETAARSKNQGELYHQCCLELYNHIVEGATYRTCANESCQRTFVRQKGRAEHGQHRTKGLKYCSASCARAQAQREFRRRRRRDP
jgi:hypothetical protein